MVASIMMKTTAFCRVGCLLPLLFCRGVAHVQLILDKSFTVSPSSCAGGVCRKELIGGGEVFGLGKYECTKRIQYGAGIGAPTENLFELAYYCKDADGVVLETAGECKATVCLDASTDPNLQDITYQLAFEGLTEEVEVVVKLYFNYMDVEESLSPIVTCPLQENCHRKCTAGEALFETVLTDEVGDGWNSGALGRYDHFSLDAKVAGGEIIESVYLNSLLGGKNRTVPLCLADGQYLFSTDFLSPRYDGGTPYESNWFFCGSQGILSEYVYVNILDGVCLMIDKWDVTPSPATEGDFGSNTSSDDQSEVIGSNSEGEAGSSNDVGDGEGRWGEKMVTLAFAALGVATVGVVVGLVAKSKGWFGLGNSSPLNPPSAAGQGEFAGGIGDEFSNP